ncbi:MAG: Type 1 glutamine amidotransferase-like domain-containing protein [Tannerella sp.]|jgi:dipeptidase E|nr:Type 1 glutamine amidotransferase-like domain-containing protein [Tannerella sp.]
MTKRLFLSSFFKDVANLFPAFAKEELKGKIVTFIPTAAVPEKVKFYVGADRKALEKLGMTTDELDVSTASRDEIYKKLQTNDYIFVSGGNTFFLLQELRRTGTDKIIVEEIGKGKIYIGASAGSMILSQNIEYVKFMDNLKVAPDLNDDFSSLGVIDFCVVPHAENFPFKKAAEKIISTYGSQLKLYPISNSQVVLAEDDWVEVKNG